MDESHTVAVEKQLAETRLVLAAYACNAVEIRHLVTAGGVEVTCKLADRETIASLPANSPLVGWWNQATAEKSGRLAQVHPGATPLHAACASWREGKQTASVIRQLLDLGADADALDEAGNTPLHLACCSGNAEIIGLLFEASSDASLVVRNATGLSPLATVLRLRGERGYRDVERPSTPRIMQILGILLSSGRVDPRALSPHLVSDLAPVWRHSDDPALLLGTLLKCGARCDAAAALDQAQAEIDDAIGEATAEGREWHAADMRRRRDCLVRLLLESAPEPTRFWPWIGLPSGRWSKDGHAAMLKARRPHLACSVSLCPFGFVSSPRLVTAVLSPGWPSHHPRRRARARTIRATTRSDHSPQ